MPGFALASLALLAAWSLLLLISESTRREQLIMSLVGLVVAPGALLVTAADFRQGRAFPNPIGWEDLIFTLSLFGISAVIYQVLVSNGLPGGRRLKARNGAVNWIAHLFIVAGVWLFVAFMAHLVLGLNSLAASSASALLIGLYMVAERRDLLLNALVSGIFAAILVFLVEQIFFVRVFPEAADAFWQTENVSGLMLSGVPAEEIVWAAMVGFSVGPLYEYLRRWHNA